MHELAFADAANPPRFGCLRLPLLPYSIGHEILLLQTRNPLLLLTPEDFNNLSAEHQIFAVKTAVLICAQNWQANTRPHKWLRLWGWLTRRANYPLAIAEFRNYLEAGRTYPPMPDEESYIIAAGKSEDDEKGGRGLGTPLVAQMVNFLSTRFKEPMDVPFGLATWLYMGHMESEGRMRIENEKEAEVRSEMAAHRAAVIAEELAQAKDKCQP